MNALNTYHGILMMAFIGSITYLAVFQVIHSSHEQQIIHVKNQLIQEATAHYENIKQLEIWHDKVGGIFKEDKQDTSYHFDIVSLNPKKHYNLAQGFAASALHEFKLNNSQNTYYTFSEDDTNFEFVGVLHTEESCLECHSNYQLGDVRGGIHVNLPLDNYRQAIKVISDQKTKHLTFIFIIFLLTVVLLATLFRKLNHNRYQLKSLNNSLEKRVFQKTFQLQQLYSREHYLKDLLEHLTEINQALISSYSISNIVETSIKKLETHPNYRLISFSFFDGHTFHINYKSGDLYGLINQDSYSTEELKQHKVLNSTYNACISGKDFTDNTYRLDSPYTNKRRIEDYTLTGSLAIPLIEDDTLDEYSILSLWTDRENGFEESEVRVLKTVASDICRALSAYKQREMSRRLQEEQLSNYEETILAFVDMIEHRDAYTAGHTVRVAQYARMIAEEMLLEEDEILKLEKAAILHDIGKIATPDAILLKPGRLTSIEHNLIKQHVLTGYKMLSRVKIYAELAEIMKYHHERYDGKGYPYGIRGDQIPLLSHIMIVADAFDAMTTNRIYKGRKSASLAIDEIQNLKGQQFHPRVVDAAKKVLCNATINDTSQLPKNDLEKQRFSYFFNDALTGVFNVEYLKIILNQELNFDCLHLIWLNNFTEYNSQLGWSKGNEALMEIASQLTALYENGKIFRFHGDDFLVLLDCHSRYPSKPLIDLSVIDPKNIIEVKTDICDIGNKEDVGQLFRKLKIIGA
ncbi:MAG: HD domain-containing protein [Candidatus Thiodiazotropha taylori]|nr:HD domain-containing protein [Candidatus Thiodiazotropha taylori]